MGRMLAIILTLLTENILVEILAAFNEAMPSLSPVMNNVGLSGTPQRTFKLRTSFSAVNMPL